MYKVVNGIHFLFVVVEYRTIINLHLPTIQNYDIVNDIIFRNR